MAAPAENYNSQCPSRRSRPKGACAAGSPRANSVSREAEREALAASSPSLTAARAAASRAVTRPLAW